MKWTTSTECIPTSDPLTKQWKKVSFILSFRCELKTKSNYRHTNVLAANSDSTRMLRRHTPRKRHYKPKKRRLLEKGKISVIHCNKLQNICESICLNCNRDKWPRSAAKTNEKYNSTGRWLRHSRANILNWLCFATHIPHIATICVLEAI